jgi:hypothetical protein
MRLICLHWSHAPETLQQTKTLNVGFQDVDPAMMQPALALLVAGQPISSQQHPYFHEIGKVTRSLSFIPHCQEPFHPKASRPAPKSPLARFLREYLLLDA